ncbi:MAG: hypothetical protein L0Z62_33145 [Gemmataceae bacterium]|nr:hypothetical protein [Gemmataceae bacterium]
MRKVFAGAVGLFVPLLALAQQPTPVPPGTPVTIQVTPAPAAAPNVTITLGPRRGRVTPHRQGCCHTGGGNIDVAQPSPDTVVVTMTGVATATGTPCKAGVAGLDFDLDQCFEVTFEKPDVKAAKLTLEGRVIGLLRSHSRGTAEATHGCASVQTEAGELVKLCVPDHLAARGDNVSVNDREGPCSVPIGPGRFRLRQTFHVLASHPKALLPCKAASAEFAPDPALDPLWISYWEPFHGANKRDFGFQVILKVAAESQPAAK